MIRQVTAADVEEVSRRILQESTTFFNETGKLRPLNIPPGALLKCLDDGDRMFIGEPPGNYDRLLDYSRAVTGGLFFVPSQPLLEALAEREAPALG